MGTKLARNPTTRYPRPVMVRLFLSSCTMGALFAGAFIQDACGRTPADPDDAKIDFGYADETDHPEGRKVLERAAAADPTSLSGVSQVTLAKVYDATSPPMESRGGEAANVDGAHAPEALKGTTPGIMLWGPYEPMSAGRHLVVYRFRFLEKPKKGEACFIDVAHGAVTFSGRRPKSDEVGLRWNEVAIPVHAPREMDFEFRFWPNGNQVAIDRVYVYRLRDYDYGKAFVSAMGAVKRSGFYPLPKRHPTAGQAIKLAGGRIPIAHEETLGLWRAGRPAPARIEDADTDTPLKRGDLVWVPERQAVRQLGDDKP